MLAVLEAPDDADRIFYGATGEPLVTTTQVAEFVRERQGQGAGELV